MTRKAVFLDCDGTLIDDYGQVPDSAVRAIQKARQNGHLVFLCTGRSMVEVTQNVFDIGFDGYVLASGAFVQVGSDVLVHRLQSLDALRHVADYFAAHGGGYFFQANEGVYTTTAMRDQLRRVVVSQVGDDPAFAEVDHALFTYLDTITTDCDPFSKPITKVIYYEANASIEELRKEFTDFEIVCSSAGVFGDSAGEMTIPGVNKALGIDVVVEHLGVDLADTIAIGDSYNDLEMLEHVAVGVAMGNAPQDVIDVADEVTTATTEDGIYLAFQRHGLILV